ncbi:MAG: hypothetical protein LBE25_15255 [Arthrobacter sp.]|jgi:hypothetical protein|nr:hypothetical protein [Arthrobacter sp.]
MAGRRAGRRGTTPPAHPRGREPLTLAAAAPFVWALAAWVLPLTVLGVVGTLSTRELGLQIAAPVALLCAIPAAVGAVLGLFAKGRALFCGLGLALGLVYLLGGLVYLVLR